MYKPENVFWDTYRYDGTKMGKTKNAACSLPCYPQSPILAFYRRLFY